MTVFWSTVILRPMLSGRGDGALPGRRSKDGATPAHLAAGADHAACLAACLAAGTDAESVDGAGRSVAAVAGSACAMLLRDFASAAGTGSGSAERVAHEQRPLLESVV